ncbi:TonB-dependent receptor plug domain-containing protein [Acidaminococcus intestini]|jgi:outer membrane receptor for ferrienterochelin and colicins
MDSYAAYLQDEWQLTEKLFFVPSVRWDHFDSFGAQLSPRAGLTYEFSDAARVKLNYGLGYRAPTIFELYSRMEHNFGRFSYQVWGNDALEPEKSRTFDIGIEAEKGKSSGKLSYFHNKIDNLIDTQLIGRFGSTTRYQYVNVNKVEMNGIEGEYNYRFDDHWSARATYTYLDAKNSETNTRLTGRARNNGIVELTYLSGKEKPWSATLYNTWYRDYLSGEGKNYTYSTTNFVVTKDLNRNTHLYAGVDNIFDKQFPDTDAYSINGRTWRAGVEFTF